MPPINRSNPNYLPNWQSNAPQYNPQQVQSQNYQPAPRAPPNYHQPIANNYQPPINHYQPPSTIYHPAQNYNQVSNYPPSSNFPISNYPPTTYPPPNPQLYPRDGGEYRQNDYRPPLPNNYNPTSYGNSNYYPPSNNNYLPPNPANVANLNSIASDPNLVASLAALSNSLNQASARR